MHEVKETEYGLYVEVTGLVSLDQSIVIMAEMRQIFESRETGICVFANLQKMDLLTEETQAVLLKIQRHCVNSGVKRVAVILGNATVAHQFKRLSLESGIYDYERYLDASSDPDWETKGLKWITEGIDPDAALRQQIARRRAKSCTL